MKNRRLSSVDVTRAPSEINWHRRGEERERDGNGTCDADYSILPSERDVGGKD